MGFLLAELDRHPGVEDEVLQLDLLANLLANRAHAVEAGGEDLGQLATEGDQPAPAIDLGLADAQVLLSPAIDQVAQRGIGLRVGARVLDGPPQPLGEVIEGGIRAFADIKPEVRRDRVLPGGNHAPAGLRGRRPEDG